MYPNEKFLKYFPREMLPAEKEGQHRSGCLHIGAYLVNGYDFVIMVKGMKKLVSGMSGVTVKPKAERLLIIVKNGYCKK